MHAKLIPGTLPQQRRDATRQMPELSNYVLAAPGRHVCPSPDPHVDICYSATL